MTQPLWKFCFQLFLISAVDSIARAHMTSNPPLMSACCLVDCDHCQTKLVQSEAYASSLAVAWCSHRLWSLSHKALTKLRHTSSKVDIFFPCLLEYIRDFNNHFLRNDKNRNALDWTLIQSVLVVNEHNRTPQMVYWYCRREAKYAATSSDECMRLGDDLLPKASL